MYPTNPWNQPAHAETIEPPKDSPCQSLVTGTGVRVIVRAPPPPEPRQEPSPWEQLPRVVIRPPAEAVREREALFRTLFDERVAALYAEDRQLTEGKKG